MDGKMGILTRDNRIISRSLSKKKKKPNVDKKKQKPKKIDKLENKTALGPIQHTILTLKQVK